MASAATPAIQNFLMRTSIGKRPLKMSALGPAINLQIGQRGLCYQDVMRLGPLLFDAFSSRKPVSTPHQVRGRLSLENALEHPERARQPQRDLRHVGDDAEENQHG